MSGKQDKAVEERLFYSLYRIRRVEEEIARIYPTDKIKSPIHLSIGQEAVSVGVCEALRKDDIVFGTYRGHALYLAKGGNLKKMGADLKNLKFIKANFLYLIFLFEHQLMHILPICLADC